MNGPPTPFRTNIGRPVLKPRTQKERPKSTSGELVRTMSTMQKMKAKWTGKSHRASMMESSSNSLAFSAEASLSMRHTTADALVDGPSKMIAGSVPGSVASSAQLRSISTLEPDGSQSGNLALGRGLSEGHNFQTRSPDSSQVETGPLPPTVVPIITTHSTDLRTGSRYHGSIQSCRESFDEFTHRTGPGYEYEYSGPDNNVRGSTQNHYSDVDSVGDGDIRRLSSNVANANHESENTSESEGYAGINPSDGQVHERRDGLGEAQLIGLTINSVAKHLANGDMDDDNSWRAWLYGYQQGTYSANDPPPMPETLDDEINYLPAVYPRSEATRMGVYRLVAATWNAIDALNAQRLVGEAAQCFGVGFAAVSFFDEDVEVRMAETAPSNKIKEGKLGRHFSLAAHALYSTETFVILNALEDWRFANNPTVAGTPGIRFFAAAPMVANDQVIGTFAIFDKSPRASFGYSERNKLGSFARNATRRMIKEYRKMSSPGVYRPSTLKDYLSENGPALHSKVRKAQSYMSFTSPLGDSYLTPSSSKYELSNTKQASQSRVKTLKSSASLSALSRSQSASSLNHTPENFSLGNWNQQGADEATTNEIDVFFGTPYNAICEPIDEPESFAASQPKGSAHPLAELPGKSENAGVEFPQPVLSASGSPNYSGANSASPLYPNGSSGKLSTGKGSKFLASVSSFRKEFCPFVRREICPLTCDERRANKTPTRSSRYRASRVKLNATPSRKGSLLVAVRSRISSISTQSPPQGGYTTIEPVWDEYGFLAKSPILSAFSAMLQPLDESSRFKVNVFSTCQCRQIALELGFDLVYIAAVRPKYSSSTGELLRNECRVTDILAMFPEEKKVQLRVYQEGHSISLDNGPVFADNANNKFLAGGYPWGYVVPLQKFTHENPQSIGAVLGAFSKNSDSVKQVIVSFTDIKEATADIVKDLLARAEARNAEFLEQSSGMIEEKSQPVTPTSPLLQQVITGPARTDHRTSNCSGPRLQGLGVNLVDDKESMLHHNERVSQVADPSPSILRHERVASQTGPVRHAFMNDYRMMSHHERLVARDDPIRQRSMNDHQHERVDLRSDPIPQGFMDYDNMMAEQERMGARTAPIYQNSSLPAYIRALKPLPRIGQEVISTVPRRENKVREVSFAESLKTTSSEDLKEAQQSQPVRQSYRSVSSPLERVRMMDSPDIAHNTRIAHSPQMSRSPEMPDQNYPESGSFRQSGVMRANGSMRQSRETIMHRHETIQESPEQQYTPNIDHRRRLAEKHPARDGPLRTVPGRDQ